MSISAACDGDDESIFLGAADDVDIRDSFRFFDRVLCATELEISFGGASGFSESDIFLDWFS